MFSQDFREFLKLLNENKVEYLIVGGYAVGFEDAFSKKNVKNIDGVEINFIGLNELIKNKQASGREKDLLDLKNLRNDK